MSGIEDEIGVGGAGKVGGKSPVEGSSEAAAVDTTDATGATGSVAGVDPLQATVQPADVELAEAISSGSLTPEQVRAELLERVIESQLPPGVSDAEAAQIRSEIEGLLAGDPALEDLLGA